LPLLSRHALTSRVASLYKSNAGKERMMAIKEIQVGGTNLLVEVAELEKPGSGAEFSANRGEFEELNMLAGEGFEFTATREERDLSDRIRDVVATLTAPIHAAFEGSGAEEWAMEVNFGFKGESGLPFIAKGEANASVKVTAKWKKG
jgi:hypothetical protein